MSHLCATFVRMEKSTLDQAVEFLTGLLFDGKDLRQIKRWTRSIPAEVKAALRLGAPPGFDGPACVDCGNRNLLELDHVDPHADGGPSSYENLDWRCVPGCHPEKTRADRKAGKLGPRSREGPAPP